MFVCESVCVCVQFVLRMAQVLPLSNLFSIKRPSLFAQGASEVREKGLTRIYIYIYIYIYPRTSSPMIESWAFTTTERSKERSKDYRLAAYDQGACSTTNGC